MGSVDINSNFAMTWPWWSTGVHTGSGFPHVICTACHLGFSVKEFIDVGSLPVVHGYDIYSIDFNSNFAMTWPWWSTGVHTGSDFPHVICTARPL